MANLEFEDGVFSSPTGLGADDRAGCFAIRQLLLSSLGKFSFVLPDKEEIGLIGSRAFAKSKEFSKLDKQSSMYISIDRCRTPLGGKSIATYGFDNKELLTSLKGLTGREVLTGSSTDCRALAAVSTNKVPCFNLSCGYDNEHSKKEILHFTELLETIVDAKSILDSVDASVLYSVEPVAYTLTKKAPSKSPKAAKATTKAAKNALSWDFDGCVEVNGELYDDEDVEALLHMYSYYTGKPFSQKDVFFIPEIDEDSILILNPNLQVGCVLGGFTLSQAMYDALSGKQWVMDKVSKNGLQYDITEMRDVTNSCINIPRAWLYVLQDNEPQVE
jgi:hypothetical protein